MRSIDVLVPFVGGLADGRHYVFPTPLPKQLRIPVPDLNEATPKFGAVDYTLGWGVSPECGLMEPVYVWLAKDPATTVPPQVSGTATFEPSPDLDKWKQMLRDYAWEKGLEPPKFDHWKKPPEQEN